jgi:uncharacterized protein HemX
MGMIGARRGAGHILLAAIVGLGCAEYAASRERRLDREADAKRANTERCLYLLRALSEERQLLIAQHQQERDDNKATLEIRLADAQTDAQKVDAYQRFADELRESSVRFQARLADLDKKEKALGDCP